MSFKNRFFQAFKCGGIGLSILLFLGFSSPLFPPCDPGSELSKLLNAEEFEPVPKFCKTLNPDFIQNGSRCCGQYAFQGRKLKNLTKCSIKRANQGYCKEVSQEQKNYFENVIKGEYGDLLSHLEKEFKRKKVQSYCTVGNGFLVMGKPLVPTAQNHLYIQSLPRCLHFGTDYMIAMLEWLGREVGKSYSADQHASVRLVIGDISGPKGGSLCNGLGKRRHASHTSGQDVDVGFLNVRPGHMPTLNFEHEFYASSNWWLVKKIFANPYACIKAIFLDQKHIRSLAQYAQKESEWSQYRRFIRHIPGHKTHFHVRIGKFSGTAGCTTQAHPELELDDEEEETSVEANTSTPSQVSAPVKALGSIKS